MQGVVHEVEEKIALVCRHSCSGKGVLGVISKLGIKKKKRRRKPSLW